MSYLFSRIVSIARLATPSLAQCSPTSLMHTLSLWPTPISGSAGGAWSTISMRTNVRNHFPRPREGKRVKLHGYKKRMSTKGGRAIIMHRILKGTHVLAH